MLAFAFMLPTFICPDVFVFHILDLMWRCQTENKGFQSTKTLFNVLKKNLSVRNWCSTEAIRRNEDWQFNFTKYCKRKAVSHSDWWACPGWYWWTMQEKINSYFLNLFKTLHGKTWSDSSAWRLEAIFCFFPPDFILPHKLNWTYLFMNAQRKISKCLFVFILPGLCALCAFSTHTSFEDDVSAVTSTFTRLGSSPFRCFSI